MELNWHDIENKWKKRLLYLRYQKVYNLTKSGKIGGDFILSCLKTDQSRL